MVVPGSGLVKEQAIREGLDKVLVAAGFDWREPGCSMCLAMNPDKLLPGPPARRGAAPPPLQRSAAAPPLSAVVARRRPLSSL